MATNNKPLSETIQCIQLLSRKTPRRGSRSREPRKGSRYRQATLASLLLEIPFSLTQAAFEMSKATENTE